MLATILIPGVSGGRSLDQDYPRRIFIPDQLQEGLVVQKRKAAIPPKSFILFGFVLLRVFDTFWKYNKFVVYVPNPEWFPFFFRFPAASQRKFYGFGDGARPNF